MTRARAFRVRAPFGRNPLEYAGWEELGTIGLWALAISVWSLAAALVGGFV